MQNIYFLTHCDWIRYRKDFYWTATVTVDRALSRSTVFVSGHLSPGVVVGGGGGEGRGGEGKGSGVGEDSHFKKWRRFLSYLLAVKSCGLVPLSVLKYTTTTVRIIAATLRVLSRKDTTEYECVVLQTYKHTSSKTLIWLFVFPYMFQPRKRT